MTLLLKSLLKLKLVKIKKLIESDLLLEKAKNYLSGEPEVVRVIVFDKTPDKNWLVTWHQDKTISVSDKKEIEGYAPWITFVGGALLPNSFEHVAFSKVFISSNKLSI